MFQQDITARELNNLSSKIPQGYAKKPQQETLIRSQTRSYQDQRLRDLNPFLLMLILAFKSIRSCLVNYKEKVFTGSIFELSFSWKRFRALTYSYINFNKC